LFIKARRTSDPSEYIIVDENAIPEPARVNTIFKDMRLDIGFEEAPGLCKIMAFSKRREIKERAREC